MDVLGQVGPGQCLQNAGINADADIGVLGFDPLQGRAGLKARSATTAIGNRRRWRASCTSAPSLRSVRRTMAGLRGVGICHLHATDYQIT